MAVRAKINGREFLLSWTDFERCVSNQTTCLEILDIIDDPRQTI